VILPPIGYYSESLTVIYRYTGFCRAFSRALVLSTKNLKPLTFGLSRLQSPYLRQIQYDDHNSDTGGIHSFLLARSALEAGLCQGRILRAVSLCVKFIIISN
jgi:hypothetical protein